MSFVQCKTLEEVEDILEKKPFGFITEDNRIYDDMSFSDDALFYDLNAKTVMALYDLQTMIEMVTEGEHEMPFDAVLRDAKLLDKSFKKALKAIKFKPITRRKSEPNVG